MDRSRGGCIWQVGWRLARLSRHRGSPEGPQAILQVGRNLNIDNDNIERTLSGPLAGVEIDAVLTAEDMGAYKPNHKNFQILFKTVEEKFEVEKKQLLHAAKSLPIDHVPAKELDLTSVWITRGPRGKYGDGRRYKNVRREGCL